MNDQLSLRLDTVEFIAQNEEDRIDHAMQEFPEHFQGEEVPVPEETFAPSPRLVVEDIEAEVAEMIVEEQARGLS